MEGQLLYGREVLSALSRWPDAGPLAALVRHAEREPIRPGNGFEAELTPAGERAAYEWGRHLPVTRQLLLAHSPISRCAATARRIGEGFEAVGGRVISREAMPAFGVPYVLDNEALNAIARDLGDLFTRAWLDGRLPAEILLPCPTVARDHLEVLHDLLHSAAQNTLVLAVSHDWNIMTLREVCLRLRHEEVGWPEFLDGPVFALAGRELRMAWRGHEARLARGNGCKRERRVLHVAREEPPG